jgi:hypothetical protein
VRVLWVDPGAKTGVCLYDADAQIILLSLIIPGGLKGFQEWWETSGVRYRRDVLGCESFEPEEGSHGIDMDSPIQIIGYLNSLNIPIQWQRRMQRGKGKLLTPAVLKRAGLYPKRGELKEGHQVAALQHLLAYLMKIRHRPTILLLHPKEAS